MPPLPVKSQKVSRVPSGDHDAMRFLPGGRAHPLNGTPVEGQHVDVARSTAPRVESDLPCRREKHRGKSHRWNRWSAVPEFRWEAPCDTGPCCRPGRSRRTASGHPERCQPFPPAGTPKVSWVSPEGGLRRIGRERDRPGVAFDFEAGKGEPFSVGGERDSVRIQAGRQTNRRAGPLCPPDMAAAKISRGP